MGTLKMVIIGDYERVISIIKKYFPENLKYESYEYQDSKQFMLYKKK